MKKKDYREGNDYGKSKRMEENIEVTKDRSFSRQKKHHMQRYGCLSDLRIATSLRVDGMQGMEEKTSRDKSGKLITISEPTFLGKGIRR